MQHLFYKSVFLRLVSATAHYMYKSKHDTPEHVHVHALWKRSCYMQYCLHYILLRMYIINVLCFLRHGHWWSTCMICDHCTCTCTILCTILHAQAIYILHVYIHVVGPNGQLLGKLIHPKYSAVKPNMCLQAEVNYCYHQKETQPKI